MEISKVQFAEGEYIGQVSNGKANGFGYLKYNEGGFYIGEWQDNCQTGIGAKSVKQYNALGTFLNGKRHGDFCVVEKQASSNRRDCYYIGEYKNDLKNGKGVYLDGEEGENVYLGHYANDKLNGVGYELSHPRIDIGSFDKGNFVNGKMVGKVYSFPRRESKNLSGVQTSTFYGESEEVGVGNFTYSGFGVHCNGFTSKTRTTRIGYHKMNGNDDFEGVKIYQREGTVDRAAVAIGKWNGEYHGMNGYFSRIGHNGSLDMGNYRDGKPCGKGIEFRPSGYGTDAQIIINDGIQVVTVFAKDGRFLSVMNINSKKEAVYDSDGKVYENLCTGNIIGRFEIHTYQGTLNSYTSTSYDGAMSNADADTATSQNSGANKSTSSSGKPVYVSTQKPREKTVDDYFEEFKYTGPYADLVIDDLPSSDWGKSKRIESQKPSFEPIKPQQSVLEPFQAPVGPEQKTYDYGDEYGEKISFKDRVKLEIANKKEMREAKKKANAPQKSTPAAKPTVSRGTNEKIKQTNDEYELKDNRKKLLGVKVKKEIHNIPKSVEHVCEKAFRGDTVVKEVHFPSNVSFDDKCFMDCTNLSVVDLSNSFVHITSEMFKNCVNLNRIIVPSIPSILIDDVNAFENTGDVKVVGKDLKTEFDLDTLFAKFLKGTMARMPYEHELEQRKREEELKSQSQAAQTTQKTVEHSKTQGQSAKNTKKSEESKKIQVQAPPKLSAAEKARSEYEKEIEKAIAEAHAIVERRDGKVYLKGYSMQSDYIIIPRGVELIDNASFAEIKNVVESITINGSIPYLGLGVFDGFVNLKKVDARNVVLVDKGVFKDCANLKEVIVFEHCKVKHGAFPKGLKVKKEIAVIGIDKFRHNIYGKRFKFTKKK